MILRLEDGPSWLAAIRRYLLVLAAANGAWEFAQMPLYTIWRDGTLHEIVLAGLHCTVGDVLIGLSSLIAALVLFGAPEWPRTTRFKVGAATVAFGIAYTIYSEWKNVGSVGGWVYSDLMPVLPPLGTGLSPLLQWAVVPILASAALGRTRDA